MNSLHPLNGCWAHAAAHRVIRLGWLLVCAALLGHGPHQVRASHVSGAQLTHTCLGNGQYQFTMILYRDCAGVAISGNVALQLQNTCGLGNITLPLTLSGSQNVSQLCPQDLGASTCSGGSLPGTEAYSYVSDPITLAPCAIWTINFNSSVLGYRNTAILNLVNPGSASLHISTTLNTQAVACDQSPVVSGAPIPYVCLNTPVSYSFGATDADGHTLTYALVGARHNATTPIPYVLPHSPAVPIPGAQFDPVTGLLTFTPTQAGSFVVVVEISQFTTNGVLVGTVQRDIQFVVVPCVGAPPDPNSGTINGLTGTAQQVGPRELRLCGNGSFCFTATFTDSDPGSSLLFSSTVEQVLPGATVSVSGTNPLVATICWTSVPGPSGTVTFTVTISDCSPGSLAILQDYTYTVDITPSDPLQLITSGDTAVNCPGDAVVLEVMNIVGGTPPLAISWADAQGHVLGTATTLPVAVFQPSIFTITVTDQCGQSRTDTLHVGLQTFDPLVLTTSPDQVRCDEEDVLLEAMVTGGAAPTNIFWVQLGSNTPSVTVAPAAPTSFTVIATDACGNVATGSINVGIERPEVTIVPMEMGFERWRFEAFSPQSVAAYAWDLGDGSYSQAATPQHQFMELLPRVVQLTITTTNGCLASDTVVIEPAGQLFFPNAFTPDGDGINDHFGPVGHGVELIVFRIFDRWGTEVFVGREMDAAWDGRSPDGSPAPTGVYHLRHEVRAEGRPTQRGSGHITLLRGDIAVR